MRCKTFQGFLNNEENKLSDILDNEDNNNIKSEVELLKKLLDCLKLNASNFDKKACNTIIHEYGHLYEAIRNGFKFTLMVVISKGKCKNQKIHHLFYQKGKTKTETIEYSELTIEDKSKSKTFNGMALFFKHKDTDQNNRVNVKTMKKILRAGFKYDLCNRSKNLCKSLTSFGLPPSFNFLFTILFSGFLFGVKSLVIDFSMENLLFVIFCMVGLLIVIFLLCWINKGTDVVRLIKMTTENANKLNKDFSSIDTFLYTKEEECPSNEIADKLPLNEYKAEINISK